MCVHVCVVCACVCGVCSVCMWCVCMCVCGVCMWCVCMCEWCVQCVHVVCVHCVCVVSTCVVCERRGVSNNCRSEEDAQTMQLSRTYLRYTPQES